MSRNCFCVNIERTKLSRRVLYHFAIFAIVNKILITKNCRKLVFNNFLLKYYQLYRRTAKDENCLFSSHRILRIFSEFFQNFLILYFHIGKKCSAKKLIKNSEKIRRVLWKEIKQFSSFCKIGSIWVKNYWRPIFGNF